jgi:hypothetical protein
MTEIVNFTLNLISILFQLISLLKTYLNFQKNNSMFREGFKLWDVLLCTRNNLLNKN